MNRPNDQFIPNNSNLWLKLIEICIAALSKLPERSDLALLNFWTYRGGGKTTFLYKVLAALSAPESAVIGVWDVATSKLEPMIQEILHAVETATQAKKVVLLDNLDALLRTGDGEAFFELERQLVLKLLERKDTLLITTSQIPVMQWSEYEVRIAQENHPIPALTESEVAQIAEAWSLDFDKLFIQSLGYPRILYWLSESPNITPTELAQRIEDYFLIGLPSETKELAFVASLLPLFDVGVLRDVLQTEENAEQEGLYADYVDRIRELIGIGLVVWDMQMGTYRFCNSTVRRLLARSFCLLRPVEYESIHNKSALYYQAESRRAGYLHYTLISALYHMAQGQYVREPATVGEHCLKWVRNNLSTWKGADWDAVLSAWQSGAGDESVRKELRVLLGTQFTDEIGRLLEETKRSMEVLQ